MIHYNLVARASKPQHPGGDFLNGGGNRMSSNSDFLAGVESRCNPISTIRITRQSIIEFRKFVASTFWFTNYRVRKRQSYSAPSMEKMGACCYQMDRHPLTSMGTWTCKQSVNYGDISPKVPMVRPATLHGTCDIPNKSVGQCEGHENNIFNT